MGGVVAAEINAGSCAVPQAGAASKASGQREDALMLKAHLPQLPKNIV
jgi:hypothetical protein